ncbi:MAG TPA: metallophosphoesterase [Chloroflexota bacterium]|nr:metallophosphoesterase [Chloroflexota bacterium]
MIDRVRPPKEQEACAFSAPDLVHEPPDGTSFLVVGDIHGQLGKLLTLLRQSKLIDGAYEWSGGRTRLWFMGDYFDRGPDALGVLDLIMHLQASVGADNGEVGALLGNHDVQLLSAHRFSQDQSCNPTFVENWLGNGGDPDDLAGLTDDHLAWIMSLPSLVRLDDRLLAHADSDFYLRYGDNINAINAAVAAVLRSDGPDQWQELVSNFVDRHVFDDTHPGGVKRARRFLDQLGANQLIHAHTPIDKVTRVRPEEVSAPYLYADGLCVNVDGGMYRGGPGFLYRVED